METRTRRPDVDWLRVLLFGGLIAYHLGLIYAAWSPYALKSDHREAWVEVLLLTTHPWRMSVLFLISGVATRFAVGKLAASRLLLNRTLQLIPPLLFGIAFLVPIQTYLEATEIYGYDKGYFAFLVELFTHSHTVMIGGRKLELQVYAHLWFIFYLWSYIGVVLLATWAQPKWLPWVQDKLEKALRGPGILLWPLAITIVLRMTVFAPHGITLKFEDDWYNHAISLGMFLFGFLIARSEQVWAQLVALRWPALGIAVIGWAVYVVLWSGSNNIPEYIERSHPFMQICYPIERWGAIVAVLGFARRNLNSENKVVRYLNGGMFTYYLVHQPAMLLVLTAAKPLGLQAAIEAAVVAAGTVAICGLSYEIARASGWFGILLGVRRNRARVRRPSVPRWRPVVLETVA